MPEAAKRGIADGPLHLGLGPCELARLVFHQADVGQLHQHRAGVEHLQQDVLETDVAAKQSLVVQVVDAVEKLERDAVPRGKAQLPVPCSDVVAQWGVAVLQAVPVVGLVVA